MLSQFYMVVHRKWKMTQNTKACHETKEVKYLSYDEMTPEGFECGFAPNSQELHVYKVILKKKGREFGANSGDNKSVFGRSRHVVMESDGSEVE